MTKFSSISTLTAAACSACLLAIAPAIAQPTNFTVAASGSDISILSGGAPFTGQIQGTAGGTQDSAGCGWMGSQANHTFSVSASNLVSMKIRVTNPSGNGNIPYTLMIKNANDPGATPFCAIAAEGIPAEIGGVWSQEGNYQVFVGNFESSTARNAYVLRISK